MTYDGESATVGALAATVAVMALAAVWGRAERQRDRETLREDILGHVRLLQREAAPAAYAVAGGRYQIHRADGGGPLYLFDTHGGWFFASSADHPPRWEKVLAPPWVALTDISVLTTTRNDRAREILARMRAECTWRRPSQELSLDDDETQVFDE